MNPLAFIKKHSALCALLAVLAAAVAAPYLIPENPDSAIFRSGAFTALLLIGCFIPVRRAIEFHYPRTLRYSIGLAFAFTLCLSVGSELFVYDQLLPGLGSMIRRFAVPVLASPLIGALISHALMYRPKNENAKHLNLPYICYFLLFTLCYVLVLLAFFPGIINYDFQGEIGQYYTGNYYAAHPVFHTLFTGVLYKVGGILFGSATGSALMYSLVQLVLLAAMYAAACRFVQKRVPAPVMLLLILCFTLLPFHGILAISTVKDALFSGLCLLLCLILWQIAENPAAFFENRRRILRFSACCLGIALIRLNGVFAYLPACLVLLLFCRDTNIPVRRGMLIAVPTLLVCLLVPRGFEFAVHAQKAPASEMMSIPCQQLMRTAEYADISEEEYAKLNEWFSNVTFRYHPNYADPAKGNLDYERFVRDPSDFWSTYLDYAKRYPQIYVEAFLSNCAGLWYPDDRSHAHSMDSEDWDFVYLKAGNIVPEFVGTVEAHSYIPALRKLLLSSTHSSRHEQIPFLSLIFRPAIYTYLLMFAVFYLNLHRAKRWSLCTLPIWGILLSLFFSACILVRYAYPIMTAVPVLLALAFGERATEE